MKTVLLVLLNCFLLINSLRGAVVKLGDEVLAEEGFKQLKGKRVGLLTNPSGVNRNLVSIADILHKEPGVNLVKLLAPEHGIFGDIVAGEHVTNRTEPRTGLPVYSVYGKTRKPTAAMLSGLDVVVYDLQDTGCRSYTFISSMGLAMEACAESGVEFLVLDRPNPLGGERIEGPLVRPQFRSFVSQWDIPYVYGMTAGELARMINGEGWIKQKCRLSVIPMRGWKRSMVWSDTGLPWVPTSPHIPHADSTLFYVATGILGELYQCSIGVGYTLPFECVGLTNINMHTFSDAMNDYRLPGVRFKPITYKPFYATFKDKHVFGTQVYLTDPNKVELMPLNFYFLEALQKTAGIDLFAQATKTTNGIGLFDKVIGTDAVRKGLQSHTPVAEITKAWKKDEQEFRRKRKKYLLY